MNASSRAAASGVAAQIASAAASRLGHACAERGANSTAAVARALTRCPLWKWSRNSSRSATHSRRDLLAWRTEIETLPHADGGVLDVGWRPALLWIALAQVAKPQPVSHSPMARIAHQINPGSLPKRPGAGPESLMGNPLV